MKIGDSLPDFDDVFVLEGLLSLVTKRTNVNVYDFDLRPHFRTQSLFRGPGLPTVARIGAVAEYERVYADLAAQGFPLINDPAAHLRASSLPHWYPLIEHLTPRSITFDAPPEPGTVEAALGWPVFVKGERQTSRHQKALSVARDARAFEQICATWERDPILRWQRMICREFVPLEPVGPEPLDGTLRPCREFRLFAWHGSVVGLGPYWHTVRYAPTAEERRQLVALGEVVASLLAVPFLTVDLARTTAGDLIVIEVNDGQESGLAGTNAVALWQAILAAQRRARPGPGIGGVGGADRQ